ncbi:hypothetical protein C4J85_1946 [Pseudomonas sp. R4-34-07]|nr:hypothetical protein C4J90_1949 [Pseudomonas sp. R2-60-08W]AZF52431.1 hypothetical protein C4J85_1946 [Pseudomonas sp. R4-34-07]
MIRIPELTFAERRSFTTAAVQVHDWNAARVAAFFPVKGILGYAAVR